MCIRDSSFTALGQGARSTIANPFAAAALPVVNSLSPTTGPAAGGTNVVITGTGFTGASAAKFGTLAATEFTVVSDSKIVAKAPAQAASTKTVQVTTPAGVSVDNSTFDDFVYV